MHPRKIQQNTLILTGLLLVTLVLQMALYYSHLSGRIFPLGNALYGLGIFSFLMLLIYKNQLHRQFVHNKWALIFFGYICLSFLWGFIRYKTATTLFYDLWLFSYLVILVLIPPYSFSVRTFDTIIAFFVCLYFIACTIIIIRIPEVLYDRDLFGNFIRHPGMLSAGSVYLLFKYSNKLGVFTLIGIMGVLTDAALYGVAGAYRGRLILALLAVALFLVLILKSTKVNLGFKFLATATSLVICVAAIFIITTKLEEQLFIVSERFEEIALRYEQTGDISASDARLREFQYFRMLNPDRKLIFGHGIGALWYDFYGMFGAAEGGVFAGARTMLHINWAHIIFKIGIVGFVILMMMLITHWRKYPAFIKQNWPWWAFVLYYAAYSTYYGDKELTIRALVFLMVLVHPWLFKTFELSRRDLAKLQFMKRWPTSSRIKKNSHLTASSTHSLYR